MLPKCISRQKCPFVGQRQGVSATAGKLSRRRPTLAPGILFVFAELFNAGSEFTQNDTKTKCVEAGEDWDIQMEGCGDVGIWGLPTASALSRTHSITYVSTTRGGAGGPYRTIGKQLQQEKRCEKWRKLLRKWLTSKGGGARCSGVAHTYVCTRSGCFGFSFSRRSHGSVRMRKAFTLCKLRQRQAARICI